MTIQKRQSGPLTRRAVVETVDAEKRTVDVTWTTGASVRRYDWWNGTEYDEVLSLDPAHVRMGRLQSGKAPLLPNHDSYDVARVLGVVESATLEGDKGTARVRFAAAGVDPEADMIFTKMRDGIVQNVSVGYRTWKIEKPQTVNRGDVPTYRVVDWEPYEISAVAMGADDGAKFRSAAPTNEVEIINPQSQRSNPMEKTPQELEAAKALEEQKKREAEALEKRKLEDAAEVAVEADRVRTTGIRHAAKTGKIADDVTEKAIKDGTTVEAFRAFVLEELAKRDDASRIGSQIGSGVEVGEEDHQKFIRGATAGMLARNGKMPMLAALVSVLASKGPDVQRAFKGFDATDDGGEFRGMSLSGLARECLERRGVSTRGMNDERIIMRALELTGRMGNGQNTSSDFAVILENVMYKTLLGAYAQVDDTWRLFCGVDSVQDFRASNRYRTGAFGALDTVGESGELKNKSIPDGLKLSITTETRGNIIALSRKAIINDDMGALLDVASKFGRAAGLSIEKDVYALLAQNSGLGPTISQTLAGTTTTAPLFDDTAWGNVSTGAALSMAAIEADRVKMAQQKDINNQEYLALRPAVLLVPEALRGEADVINRSKYDPTASSAFERPNIVGGLFRQIVSTPRLSGTRRYIFTEPGAVPAIVVAFLNGVQAPFMDQMQGFRTDGIEWKLRHEFLVQAFDPKGAITNAGT